MASSNMLSAGTAASQWSRNYGTTGPSNKTYASNKHMQGSSIKKSNSESHLESTQQPYAVPTYLTYYTLSRLSQYTSQTMIII